MQDLLMLLINELLAFNLYTPAVQKILLYFNLNWVFPTNVAVWSAPTARNHESQQQSLVRKTHLPIYPNQPAEISWMSKGSTWHPEDLACWQRSARLHPPSALPAKVVPETHSPYQTAAQRKKHRLFPWFFSTWKVPPTSTGLMLRGEFLAAVLWRIPVISPKEVSHFKKQLPKKEYFIPVPFQLVTAVL